MSNIPAFPFNGEDEVQRHALHQLIAEGIVTELRGHEKTLHDSIFKLICEGIQQSLYVHKQLDHEPPLGTKSWRDLRAN